MRCAPPMSDSKVQQAKKFAVPRRTKKDTLWCISLWKEWREARNSRSEEQIPSDICKLSNHLLQHWLSRYVLEVRKKDGMEYPPDPLYHIVESCDFYVKTASQKSTSLKDNFMLTSDPPLTLR